MTSTGPDEPADAGTLDSTEEAVAMTLLLDGASRAARCG